jgi:hypothetical protein
LGAHDSFREDNLPNTNKFFSVKRPDHTGQPAGELGASEIRTGQPSRRPAAPPQACRIADTETGCDITSDTLEAPRFSDFNKKTNYRTVNCEMNIIILINSSLAHEVTIALKAFNRLVRLKRFVS